jgi:streptogramin lyase
VANDPASSPFLTIYDPANATTPYTGVTSACLQKPGFLAFDGNGNAWVSNQNATSGSNYTVCEFDSSGALLSNSIGFGSHGLNLSRGIGVDPSGNVWVSNYIQSSSNTVTELVGVAVPAVTPIAVAIKTGKVGTRP